MENFFNSLEECLLLEGDCREHLPLIPDCSIDVTVTSPPYYRQKDYEVPSQIGWNQSREEYLESMSLVLSELFRVTKPTGSAFIVIADTYRHKSLQLIPQSIALVASKIGWKIRNDLIWRKTDAPPERVTDRWRYSHEHIFFLTKKPTGYHFDMNSIRVPYADVTKSRWGNGQKYGGRKSSAEAGPKGQRFRRGKHFSLHPLGAIPPDILSYATSRSPDSHYATYPPKLVLTLLEATSRPGNIVFDPFVGSGTTGQVALQHFRRFIGFDVNSRYLEIATRRCSEAIKDRSNA